MLCDGLKCLWKSQNCSKMLYFIAQTLQVNAIFAGDLLTTEYHRKVLKAIISLATSDIPCTCNDASVMVYL